jgi:hypothetical protein
LAVESIHPFDLLKAMAEKYVSHGAVRMKKQNPEPLDNGIAEGSLVCHRDQTTRPEDWAVAQVIRCSAAQALRSAD